MIITDRLGRAAAGLALACALVLAGCATLATRPDDRCRRWRLVLEPRLTISKGLDGPARPIVSLTARPVCAQSARTS